jgi:hypothetical protein
MATISPDLLSRSSDGAFHQISIESDIFPVKLKDVITLLSGLDAALNRSALFELNRLNVHPDILASFYDEGKGYYDLLDIQVIGLEIGSIKSIINVAFKTISHPIPAGLIVTVVAAFFSAASLVGGHEPPSILPPSEQSVEALRDMQGLLQTTIEELCEGHGPCTVIFTDGQTGDQVIVHSSARQSP